MDQLRCCSVRFLHCAVHDPSTESSSNTENCVMQLPAGSIRLTDLSLAKCRGSRLEMDLG